ncbi:ATPase [Azospirillum sp. TSO22-1]|nr:ATPase [Azospirillum sp. TSO22-1]
MGADPQNVTPEKPPAPEKAKRTPGRKEAYLYIGWPNNGETVKSPFKVWFGMRNFGVAPAGVTKEGTGHHHLLIDSELTNFDEPIPNDKKHMHFGKGQTETVLELPPGKHTLQLVLGDTDHVPHNPPIMSKKITITVRGGEAPPQVSQR